MRASSHNRMTPIVSRSGLGGRVAAIANGLAAFGKIIFAWEANAECPLCWREVFPHGIEGVAFSDGPAVGPCTRIGGVGCTQWIEGGDYSPVMAAMAGAPEMSLKVAVFVRFFRTPDIHVPSFAERVAVRVREIGASGVFLMADSRRAEIAAYLRHHGVVCVTPQCPELASDLGRGRDATLAFLSDWKTLLASGRILAYKTPSAILFPARAAGVPVEWV